METTLYNFAAVDIKGEIISLEEFRGKIVLIVNTASKCGLTPQYEGLQKLYEKFRDRDFVILGFPGNQFANQEPGDEYSIQSECLLNYGVTFPMFAKVDVNGKNAHVLFKWLKNELPGFLTKNIKWNFTKFLIDRNGKPVKRFSPVVKPEKIEEYLAKYYFSN